MSNAIVVEQRSVTRDYGFNGVQAIVDHPTHGRILVQDGFGGMDSIAGGAVRWTHGMVVKLHSDDSFKVLDRAWNDRVTVIEAAANGYDGSRPLQDWSGIQVESLAKSLGLQ